MEAEVKEKYRNNENFACQTKKSGVILFEKSFQRRVLHLCRFEHTKQLYINPFTLV